ncbi:MAG: AbrB/MazE/SpoVT family DNA-binding domain-containing protein [Solirubrobacteraceae bacterium]
MATSVVSEKGQVTIPKLLRERLGIRPGQALDFREDGGRLVVTKATERDPLDELYGSLDLGRSSDDFVRELRGGR